MQELYTQSQTAAQSNSVEVSRVLRNTYMLLGMTLAFSALTAGIAMAINAPFMGLWMLLPYFICLFMVEKTKNSVAGLFWVFALTGWLGFTIGPLLSFVSTNVGYEPILMALGGTAVIFFAMSGYVLTTRKDLSFMGSFLITGLIVAFLAALGAYFFNIQGLSLAVSCMFLLLASGMIAWQTSAIIHGGERNYISATVTLYVMIYNIFSSLLHLILSFSRD